MDSQPQSEATVENDPGQMFGDPKKFRGDLALLEQTLSRAQRFPISEATRKKLSVLIDVAASRIVDFARENPGKDISRGVKRLGEVMEKLDRLNMKNEDRVLGRAETPAMPVQVNVTQTTNVAAAASATAQPINPADVARELIAHDPQYIDALRQRAMHGDGLAGAVGQAVQPGEVATVPAHGPGGPLPDGTGGGTDQAAHGP